MSTNIAKNHFALIFVRIGFFPIVVIFTLRCFAEIIEDLSDILCLFRSSRVRRFIGMLEDIHAQIRDFGPLDLADVDIKTPDARVRVHVLAR